MEKLDGYSTQGELAPIVAAINELADAVMILNARLDVVQGGAMDAPDNPPAEPMPEPVQE